jgi:hypothetical protein
MLSFKEPTSLCHGSQINKDEIGGTFNINGVVGRPRGNKSLGIPMHSWKKNTRTIFREKRYACVNYDELGQNGVMLKMMKLEVL